MADLISREALMRKMLDPIYTWQDYDEMENLVSYLPAVDAVEVVRCKDCEWGGMCEAECLLREIDKIADPYCAAGKRREENGKTT